MTERHSCDIENATAAGSATGGRLPCMTALDALALVESYIPDQREHRFKVSAVTVMGRLREALADCGQLESYRAHCPELNPAVRDVIETARVARSAAHRALAPVEIDINAAGRRVLLDRLRAVRVVEGEDGT